MENFLVSNNKMNRSINEYKELLMNGTSPWIALGDSHTANSLLTSTNIDNLGYAGDNLDSMSIKGFNRVKRLKPKGIILQATPHIFSFYRLSDNQKQKTNYLITNNKYTFEFLNPINRPYLINYLKAIIKNKFDIYSKDYKSTQIEKSWIEKSLKTKNYETSTRVQLHMPILQFQNHLSLKKYSNMIFALLNLNIDVCLVRYPVSKLYLNKTKKIKVFQDVNETIKKIAYNHDINFVDLSGLLEDKHFYDTDHVKTQSKKIVTDLVKKGCKIDE